MKVLSPRILAFFSITALTAAGLLSLLAESEPDNTPAEATDVTATLLLKGQNEFGNLINGDQDYYKVTNNTPATKPYTIELEVGSVAGADQASLKVFESDGTTQIGTTVMTDLAAGTDPGYATIDIAPGDFPAGATIIICVEPVSLTTSKFYNLSGKYYTPETETNDTPATGDDLPISPEGEPPCFGRGAIDNGDNPDYWKITHTGGFTDKLQVTFTHSSGADAIRFRILKSDGLTQIFNDVADFGINKSFLQFEIRKPEPNEVFFLCVEDDTLSMEVPYLVSVQGFDIAPPAASANDNSALIAALERKCKKLKKKVRKAKSRAKKRRLKKKLKKCLRKLRALRG